MKILNILMITILSWFLMNCSDESVKPKDNVITEPDTTLELNYHLYYSMNQSKGWRAEQSGLFKLAYNSSAQPLGVESESIEYISGVGKNGKLVFEFEKNPVKFSVLNLDETLTPIKLPKVEPSDPTNYFYAIPPHIEISSDGTKGAYFTVQKEAAASPVLDIQKLAIIDLENGLLKETLYEFKFFYEDALADKNVNYAVPFGEYFLVNEDASNIWFVLNCMSYENANMSNIGFAIVKFDNGNYSLVSDLYTDSIRLAGIDLKSGKLFAYLGDDLKVLNSQKKLVNTTLTKDNMGNPRQFSVNKSEMAVWTNDGIAIYNPVTEKKISDVISWDSILVQYVGVEFPGIKKSTSLLSISPDGGMILFGVDKKTTIPSYDLYAIRRNGIGLKKVIGDVPIGNPSVSFGFK